MRRCTNRPHIGAFIGLLYLVWNGAKGFSIKLRVQKTLISKKRLLTVTACDTFCHSER